MVPLLHPGEEHKGYADGENVHFHRKIPSSADLEFKRNGEPINLPQILAPKELYQKLQEKHIKKEDDGSKQNNDNIEGDNNHDGVKHDGREEGSFVRSLFKARIA